MKSSSFISKPPSSWTEHTERLSHSRFYLMARVGPTVFQIKDDDDRSYRVTLGNPHRCTCDDTTQPCIHAAHCIVKILKVPITHHLAYQQRWTDSDLEQVLSGACSSVSSSTTAEMRRKLRIKRKGQENPELNDLSLPFVDDTDCSATRQPLEEEEDNYCPICQESMLIEEKYKLTWCRDGCGNNLHVTCMMKYSQHLQNNHKDTNCPLCRASWNMEKLQKDHSYAQKMKEKIEREINDKKKRASLVRTVPVHCSQCSCSLNSLFLRCITCTHLNYISATMAVKTVNSKLIIDFCEGCFSRIHASGRETHISHLFLTNDSNSDTPERSWGYMIENDTRKNVVDDAINTLPDIPSLISKGFMVDYRRSRCWICNEMVPKDMPSSICPPCHHVAHSQCLQKELQRLMDETDPSEPQGFHQILRFRCACNGCGKRIFPGFKRTMKKLMSSNKAAKSTPHANLPGGVGLCDFGIAGVAVGGNSAPTGTAALVGIAAVGSGTSNLQRPLLGLKMRKFTEQFRVAIINDLRLNGESLTNQDNGLTPSVEQQPSTITLQPRRRIATFRSLSMASQERTSSDDLRRDGTQNIDSLSLEVTGGASSSARDVSRTRNSMTAQQRDSASERRRTLDVDQFSQTPIEMERLDSLLAVRQMGNTAIETSSLQPVGSSTGLGRSNQPMTHRDRQRRLQQLGLSRGIPSNNTVAGDGSGLLSIGGI